jgi:hypothetical protein
MFDYLIELTRRTIVSNGGVPECSECGENVGKLCAISYELPANYLCGNCIAARILPLLISRHPFAHTSNVYRILTQLFATTNRQEISDLFGELKLALGCAYCGQNGEGHELSEFARRGLEFAHLVRGTKTRTATGKAVHPCRLIRDGYALDIVFMQLLIECRILCGFCHRLETAYEETQK